MHKRLWNPTARLRVIKVHVGHFITLKCYDLLSRFLFSGFFSPSFHFLQHFKSCYHIHSGSTGLAFQHATLHSFGHQHIHSASVSGAQERTLALIDWVTRAIVQLFVNIHENSFYIFMCNPLIMQTLYSRVFYLKVYQAVKTLVFRFHLWSIHDVKWKWISEPGKKLWVMIGWMWVLWDLISVQIWKSYNNMTDWHGPSAPILLKQAESGDPRVA